MELPPTKKQIRQSLSDKVQEFLQDGGNVAMIPRGLSGRENPKSALPDNHFAPSERANASVEDLQPLNNVIEDIESRRKARSKPKPTQPKKKIIYDDFGEPLRWTWVDE